LVQVFEGNLKETYILPGNLWELSKCKQKSGESLREYTRRFLKQRTELPHIPDHDVILASVSGTTCRDLVRELGRNRPQTVDELIDMVANYAASEDAVGAFFNHEGSKGKAPVDDDKGPRRKHDRSSGRLTTMISSLLSTIKSLEARRRGPSLTKFSRSPAHITREG